MQVTLEGKYLFCFIQITGKEVPFNPHVPAYLNCYALVHFAIIVDLYTELLASITVSNSFLYEIISPKSNDTQHVSILKHWAEALQPTHILFEILK